MEVQIADRTAEVELIEKNGNGIRLSVDGKAYDLDMVMTDRGICSVLCDGRSYDMEVERREGDTVAGEQLLVRLDVIVEETENQ